ncbi:lipoprotein signal peptidase [Bacteroidales bacterium OttesenSCG-928-J16]|nr:lipoprotein signal peptidase [Bacteroidales bacterium OttesenSCG-928-J16]
MSKKKSYLLPVLIIVVILIGDQILKIWVKTHMTIGQEIPIFGDWAKLYFIENNGMAFGMEFFGGAGKLILSLVRIVAVGLLGYYLVYLIRRRAATIVLVCFALIIAGAFGNIIDSAFYGLIFSESTYFETAAAFPEGGGYAPFLYGKVVDMFYCPVIDIAHADAPAWIPDFLFGHDDRLIFFRPIFNIADSAITIGLFALLFNYKKLGKFAEK